jgi:hypothetical protein
MYDGEKKIGMVRAWSLTYWHVQWWNEDWHGRGFEPDLLTCTLVELEALCLCRIKIVIGKIGRSLRLFFYNPHNLSQDWKVRLHSSDILPIQFKWPFVAATFHVADFQRQVRNNRVTSLSAACLPEAHEEEGLHAIFDFVVNSESFMLWAL